MKLRTYLVAALLIATPASFAAAAPGLVRTSATMRAGPGTGFPVVDKIPAGARITIHGCIEGGAWCDVSFEGERGWVAARTLRYLYREQYVYLPEYVEYVPVTPFVLTTYWSSFYFGRPWYHRHAYWNRFWQRHPPVMAQNPHPTGMTPGVGQAGGAPGAMPTAMPTPRTATGGSPVAAGGPASGPRVPAGSPGPTAMPGRIGQPGMGRLAGPPQGARAQMVGMRSGGGSSLSMGGVPQAGGMAAMSAPRMSPGGLRGGGGRSGSGGGFRRH
ncbi:SH3 domain-containing protein [Bradyrhizobium sp. SRS-191]|uniref:SH3 domain-containing protein n=1 Tax=Bradyrhizobium sp. SRS-191 TaxID=2962606 RepID=UPI0035BBF326